MSESNYKRVINKKQSEDPFLDSDEEVVSTKKTTTERSSINKNEALILDSEEESPKRKRASTASANKRTDEPSTLDSDDESSKRKRVKTPVTLARKRTNEQLALDSEDESSKKKKLTQATSLAKKRGEEIPLDSEDESSKKKKVPAKRGPKASNSSAGVTNWLFGSDEEDDEQVRRHLNTTESVFSRKIPGGWIRRTGRFAGDLLAELRLYKVEDVKDTKGLDRCDKAAVWVRIQGEQDSPLFTQLKKFTNLAKAKFTEEGVFFQEKKKK